MCKEKLITGVSIIQQMSKAKAVLENEVIPREKKFQDRRKMESLNVPFSETVTVNAP